MKFKTVAILGALAGAGAYVVSRWRKVEEMEQGKKLITLHVPHENSEAGLSMIEFPHLSQDFVEAILSQKIPFEQDYPEGLTVRLYHQIGFEHDEDLEKFVKLLEDLNFDTEVSVETKIVKAAKNALVSKGIILHEIFSVANLAQRQKGLYQGYSIDII